MDIVACLCRALRNLGHHVFDLDLDKHRDITDNPNGVSGGFAPIFLKPTDFDRFCDKLRPQIVILCAGGLTFHPEHAQRLKQQGIVLVGITLSDPKVFISVQAHAHVFDFHTTNARQALGLYQGAGVHNTLYFPFGVDRSLITQSNAPERYRKMTGASFRRIACAHLYEHRWMSLLETMFNCSPDSTPWLEDDRIQRIRDTLARSYPRCKPVIVSGFYGASNMGDELILRTIESGLRDSDAAVQVTVAAENPVAVERDHGLQAFSRKDLSQALHHARTAAAILLGGGGLWHDYTFEKSGGLTGIFQTPQLSMASFAPLPMMGRFFNIPCHVVGMGVGPITTPDALRMLRFVAELADTIYVRDEPSLALLSKAGVAQGKAFSAPDLVYSLDLLQSQTVSEAVQPVLQLKADGYTVIGINLRPWVACDENELFSKLVQGIRSATGSTKLVLVTIPMQNQDNLTLRKFVSILGADIKYIELNAPLEFGTLLSTLMACDILLSMRLHACLVAHRLRKPVVGMVYDPKVANHFEQIDRLHFALALDATADHIGDAISAALREQGQVPVEIHHTLLALEAQAHAAFRVVVQRIAALHFAGRVFEAPKG
nr:polysaccharide pyruvyl transferase family protein [uncultured Undibacterium sp.]